MKQLRQPTSNPLRTWAITMVLVAAQFALLGFVGAIIWWLLPGDPFGSLLMTVAALGAASSLAVGAIIRCLVRE